MNHRATLHVGRLAGVPIGIQPLWLALVGLLTYNLGHDYFLTQDPGLSSGAAYALGLLSALTLFAGIVLHELGHAIVARRRGVQVTEIDLWLLGGVSRLHGEPEAPGDELRFALAGPAVTAVLLALAGAARLAFGGVLPDWARAVLDYQVYVNAMILGFNLLPAFPLDGGRVARSLLWRRSGDRERSTDQAAAIGRAFGIGLFVFGLLTFASAGVGGLWLALIGGFLFVAGKAEAQQLHVAHALASVTAAELMSTPVVTVPASATLQAAVDSGFVAHLYGALPVVDDGGRVVGLLSLRAVRAIPAARRSSVLARDAMTTEPDLLIGPETPMTELMEHAEFARLGRAVVVDRDERPVGIVSLTDVQRRVRADELRGGAADARQAA
jgi:Zn-dependent protease/CBS domain-containing protein